MVAQALPFFDSTCGRMGGSPVMARFAFALLATLRAADAQDVFIPARQLRGSSNASVNITEETTAPSAELADTFPDDTTGFDSVGPFLEVPSPEQDANPAPAKKGWDNETGLQAAVFNTWGRSFCESHHVGTFCDQTTQVRCCRTRWGFEKCGTTVHSSRCGWHSPPSPATPWIIHQGWRPSSFCRSHHVGYFCSSHKKVHCCNDHGHFVECTTREERSWRC